MTKLSLLEQFRAEEQLEWSDPWLASLDLEYHNVNPERGLYLGLEAEGQVKRLCEEDDILRAMCEGPVDTRGGIRGLCVKRFGRQIQSVQWERIQFKTESGHSTILDLNDVVEPKQFLSLKSWRSIGARNTFRGCFVIHELEERYMKNGQLPLSQRFVLSGLPKPNRA